MASRKRSLLKTISFRIIATLTTAVLVWWFTGDLKLAGSVGLIDALSKLVIFYGHERIWDKIEWGKS